MAITVVTRWIVPNTEASLKIAKRAKAIWMKNGAQEYRVSQLFTGPHTGQWLIATIFVDMAAYAKASLVVSATSGMRQVIADSAKAGAVMQNRTILLEHDI